MATFTITTDTNIDALVGKTGADTYTISNGGTLRIDQDSRYGLNQSTSTVLGNLSFSYAASGLLLVDARKVRLIPFSGGSGSLPALNSIVSQGGAQGKLIGVWSAINQAPVTSGAIPASGFIKIKQWNDVPFAAGALSLSGVTANATGADVAGWVELVGTETRTITSGERLGAMSFLGTPYVLGTTNGVSGQTFQLPTSGSLAWFAGVYIEKNAGQNDFEFYPNAGAATAIGTEEARGKVCWIDTAGSGLCLLGHNGTSAAGYTPAAGLKVVIGNIILQNCPSAAFTTNCIPHATLATRYGFPDSGGLINMSWVSSAWRTTFMSGFYYGFDYVACLDRLVFRASSGDTLLYRCGIGQTLNYGFDWSSNFSASTCIGAVETVECVFSGFNYVNGRYPASFDSNKSSVLCVDTTAVGLTTRSSSDLFCLKFTANFNGCTITRPKIIGGGLYSAHNTGVKIDDTVYCDNINGTTGSSNGNRAIYLQGQKSEIRGFTIPIPNTHPLTSVMWLADSFGADVRNIGTRVAPLNLGAVNKSQRFISGSGGGSNTVQRCYHTPAQNNPINFTDSATTKLAVYNCHEIPPATNNSPSLNSVFRGCGALGVLINGNNLGSIYFDTFTSDTTGRLQIVNVETTNDMSTGSYNLTGTTIPTRLPNIGDAVVWEWPYIVKGHSAFANLDPGGLLTSLINYEYQLDTGNGFGAWKTLAKSNLTGESISPSTGFRLRVRAIAFTANTSVQNSLDIYTVTSLAAQEAGLHPLDVSTLQINSAVAGSTIKVQKVSDNSVLYTGTATSIAVEYAGDVKITIRNASGSPAYQEWITQTTLVSGETTTATALQQLDQ
jgi:hypothetical protein